MGKFGMAAIVTAVAFAIIYVFYKMLPASLVPGTISGLTSTAKSGQSGIKYLPGVGPSSGLSASQIANLISAGIKDGAAVAGGANSQNTQIYGPTMTQLGIPVAVQAGLIPSSVGDPTTIEGGGVSALIAPKIDPISLTPTATLNTDVANIDWTGAGGADVAGAIDLGSGGGGLEYAA